MMNLRGAKPVVDNFFKDYISKIDCSADLYNENLPQIFTDNFYNWISSSELNTLLGLDCFPSKRLVCGTAQAFDHFYLKHKDRRFRFYKGEFMYHSACLKHGFKWEYIEDARLHNNDAVIISVPFSDAGTQIPMDNLLYNCYGMDIPVLLDFAYYPCTKNINLDLEKFSAVETITFSISKAFYGAEFLRVGMRLQREDNDDGIDVFNSVEMINRVPLSIANNLVQNFSIDHNWENYGKIYSEVCAENNLEETDCIMFGQGGEEYAENNRGGKYNRVTVSDLIGQKINV